jgi:hypothetical protein
LRTFGFADARAAFVTEATGTDELAEVPVLEPLVSLADSGIGTDLDACLNDLVVFASCFDELPSFPNVVRNGLFDIHVFAGLNGPNRGQRMPMVWRGDADGIDVFALEQFPDIAVTLETVALVLAFANRLIKDVVVRVAEGNEADARNLLELLDMVFAAAIQTNDSDPNVGVCTQDPSLADGRW